MVSEYVQKIIYDDKNYILYMIIPIAVAVVILGLVVAFKSIKRVKSYETMIVASSGNIDKTLGSGLNFVNPLLETYRIDSRKRRVNIPEVGTLASDDTSILISNFSIIISISNAEKVFNMESDIESRVSYEIQEMFKQVAKNLQVEELSAEELASKVKSRAKEEENTLGIEVHSFEIGKIRQG